MATQTDTPSFGYVLSVIAGDKPGIVAGLSEGILRLGGNIESCSQAVLSGFFTLMMTLRFGTDFEPNALAAELLKERTAWKGAKSSAPEPARFRFVRYPSRASLC